MIRLLNLDSVKGENGTVILFIYNHCPFVIHINEKLVPIANLYLEKGIGFVAFSSNDAVNYPQDGPVEMKRHAIHQMYPFSYLYDENQKAAKTYDAACSQDLYVFDKNLKLTYRGQFDVSRPRNGTPITGADLIHTLNCLIENKKNTTIQKPSIGCNIKWKVPT